MIWLLRGLTVLLILCGAALAVLVWWPAPPAHESASVTGLPSGGSDVPDAASLGKFNPLAAPRPAPDVQFATRDGAPVRLADFRGRLVLVNLWATWCAPCVREMPSLDRLQAKLGPRIAILAVSQDRGGAGVVDPFLEKLDLKSLAAYLDPKGVVGHAFGVRGLPTSILIDGDGNILGRLEGAAEWDSPKMVALLERYLAPAASPLRKASAGS